MSDKITYEDVKKIVKRYSEQPSNSYKGARIRLNQMMGEIENDE